MRILAWPKAKNKKSNPFQHKLYESLEVIGDYHVSEFSLWQLLVLFKFNILHIHWPDVFVAVGNRRSFWLRLYFIKLVFALCSLCNVKVVWTMHNFKRLGQKNEDLLDEHFWDWFLSRVDGIIFMTESSKKMICQIETSLRDKFSVVIPHGDYLEQVHNVLISESNRDANVVPELLFFGSITRYKNANILLKAFKSMPLGSARLSFRGKMSQNEPDTELLNDLASLSEDLNSYVMFDNRFLTEAELVKAIKRSDLVVFPYSDVLNSGAALFALSAGRPILASDNELFRELQSAVGSDWVLLMDGDLDHVQLSHAVKHSLNLKYSNKIPNLSYFDWGNIAVKTISFYESLAWCNGDVNK